MRTQVRTRPKPPVFRLQLTTAAVNLPVSLPEVKSRLDVADTDDVQDASIKALIRASTENIERYLRRALIDQTWTMFMDRFPGRPLAWWDGVRQIADTELTDLTEVITVPRPPLDSIIHVKAHDSGGNETTVLAADYIVDTASEPGRIALKQSKSWPSVTLRTINGVEVQFIGGYGPTGSDVPEPIREAIMICVTSMNNNKSGETLKFEKVGDSSLSRFSPEETGSIIPRQARNLIGNYRVNMV